VDSEANLVALPDDSQALKAMLRTLINERNQEKRRADIHEQLAEEQSSVPTIFTLKICGSSWSWSGIASGTTVLALIVCNPLVIWRRCF